MNLAGRRLALAALAARLAVTAVTGVGWVDVLPDAIDNASDLSEQAYDQHEWRERETLDLETDAARAARPVVVLVK